MTPEEKRIDNRLRAERKRLNSLGLSYKKLCAYLTSKETKQLYNMLGVKPGIDGGTRGKIKYIIKYEAKKHRIKDHPENTQEAIGCMIASVQEKHPDCMLNQQKYE